MVWKKTVKRTFVAIALVFVLMNGIAALHAYKFTHFSDANAQKTESPKKLSTAEKIKTLFLGVSNPKPINGAVPEQSYESITLQSNKKIACWYIKAKNPKGTVILFHGYSGNKSSMLDKSDAFLKLGYNTFLVDFMGSGESEGNQTTIGFKEAQEVKSAFDCITAKNEKTIYLFGTSMGAAAVLKAIHDYRIDPSGIIIECPFGTMYQTICARFDSMHVPTFPMAGLLGFWGGVENGFNAFAHNPQEYAKSVHCPTLLLYGEKDERVSRKEIDAIYSNLQGKKQLETYPLAGHENYLAKYREKWISDVRHFSELPKNKKSALQQDGF